MRAPAALASLGAGPPPQHSSGHYGGASLDTERHADLTDFLRHLHSSALTLLPECNRCRRIRLKTNVDLDRRSVADLYGSFSVKWFFGLCRFLVWSGKAVPRSLIAPQVSRSLFTRLEENSASTWWQAIGEMLFFVRLRAVSSSRPVDRPSKRTPVRIGSGLSR
jgi:hypothetical protein